MQSPRFDQIPTTLNSAPYHYLGLTDYVELERAARRMRARAIAAALHSGFSHLRHRLALTGRALFGPSAAVDPAMGFDAEDLRALGLQPQHIRPALIGQAIGSLLGDLTARITAAVKQSVAEAELYALDDRTLHDMGLTRSTIPAAVAGELYRPGAPSNENAGEAKIQVLKTRAEAAA